MYKFQVEVIKELYVFKSSTETKNSQSGDVIIVNISIS
jgi:hypothetical protein